MINIGKGNFLIILVFLLLVLLVIIFRRNPVSSPARNDFIDPAVVNEVVQRARDTTYQTEKLTKLILLYRTDCVYSQLALPIWYQLLDEIVDRRNLEIIEQDCVLDTTLCTEFNVSAFPTIILVKDDVIHKFIGEISLNNLNYFLQSNGIYLRKAINDLSVVEPFAEEDDTTTDPNDPRILMKDKCPIITFDHYNDKDKSYYQIFSERGQYGYTVGGVDEDLTPFQAAYNTVDTYLSSLPNSSPDNMKTCARLYDTNLRDFGLCNSAELDAMKKEAKAIKSGKAKLPKGLKKQDYDNKLNVISAIETACGF